MCTLRPPLLESLRTRRVRWSPTKTTAVEVGLWQGILLRNSLHHHQHQHWFIAVGYIKRNSYITANQCLPCKFFYTHFLPPSPIGDISSISSECPYGIKLLACQLLVEITAYLRDNYLSYLADRDTPVTATAKHSVDYQRKASSASLYKLKKTAASKLHAPVIAVQDETGNMAAGKRKISGFSRQGMFYWISGIFFSNSFLSKGLVRALSWKNGIKGMFDHG